MGKREYGQHSIHRVFRVFNWFNIKVFHMISTMRPVGSRFFTSTGNGPLNYTGLICYSLGTWYVFAKCNFGNTRDQMQFNHQDGAEFWFRKYNMLFPPQFLHNRLSAHYIEINNIFFCEMMKKYISARKELLAERDSYSMEEKWTRFATNPNYVYEGLSNDTTAIQELRDKGMF